MTRRHVTVALNGDGGDESFAGYSRYVANSLAAQLDRLPLALRRASAVLGERLGGGDITSVSNKAHRLLRSLPLEPADRYARYVSGLATQSANGSTRTSSPPSCESVRVRTRCAQHGGRPPVTI